MAAAECSLASSLPLHLAMPPEVGVTAGRCEAEYHTVFAEAISAEVSCSANPRRRLCPDLVTHLEKAVPNLRGPMRGLDIGACSPVVSEAGTGWFQAASPLLLHSPMGFSLLPPTAPARPARAQRLLAQFGGQQGLLRDSF